MGRILNHLHWFWHINGEQNSDDKTLAASIIRLFNIVQRAAWPGFAVALATKTEPAVTSLYLGFVQSFIVIQTFSLIHRKEGNLPLKNLIISSS